MKKYEIEIDYVYFNENCMLIDWSAKNIGFGVLTIVFNERENLFQIETETMGEEFYKQVLEEAKKYILKKSIIVE